jgi:hypothetical protein
VFVGCLQYKQATIHFVLSIFNEKFLKQKLINAAFKVCMSRHRQVDLLRSSRILFLVLVSSEVSRRCAFIFLYSSLWMLVFLLRSSHGVATNVCDTQECCLYTITLTAQLVRSYNIAKLQHCQDPNVGVSYLLK